MAEAFLRLNGKDRLDALGVAADRLGRPSATGPINRRVEFQALS